MDFPKLIVVAAATLTLGANAQAAQGPPDGSRPEERAAIADDPPFLAPRLKPDVRGIGAGATRALFNGRDLRGWDNWLGYTEPLSTYGNPVSEPIGLNNDTKGVFRVVREDGRAAIRVSGQYFGGLITQREYSNYHLRLQYKWGPKTWFPIPRNNGVLYHSHGQLGAFFGTWMSAVEFEIVPHSVGMLLTVGDSRGTHSFATVDWRVGANVEVGHDPAIAYPYRRFMPGGRKAAVRVPAFNTDASIDAENPIGQWNTLDLYVVGDRSIHVVNGVPVMAATDLTTTDTPGGTRRPLTRGRIQLQSEGAEIYFRDLTFEPIRRLPRLTTNANRVSGAQQKGRRSKSWLGRPQSPSC